MHNVDFLGKLRQKVRLFHRRIAAAYHDQIGTLEKGPVAGGAGGNPDP